jgi:hypothetical protein
MKYELLQNNPSITGIIVMIFITLLAMVLASAAPNGFTMAIGLIVVGITLLTGFNLVDQFAKIEKGNKIAVTENLKTKYDIKEVYWDARETTAEPKDTESNENIVIESTNGKKYVFKYKLDLKSGEPTLSDMPVAGGTAPQEAVTAESLLKNK